MAYIEQRFYDDGAVKARLISGLVPVKNTDTYDHYVDQIRGDSKSDVLVWVICNLVTEDISLEKLVDKFLTGEWVDVSKYC